MKFFIVCRLRSAVPRPFNETARGEVFLQYDNNDE